MSVEQLNRLYEAMLATFPRRDDLALALRRKNYQSLAPQGTIDTEYMEIIVRAEARNWVVDLAKLVANASGDPDVVALAAEIAAGRPPAPEPRDNKSDAARYQELQRLVRPEVRNAPA